MLSNVLDSVWAFSIAIDGGTKSSVPYLDIRARFFIGPILFNVHVVALPMYESHSVENMAISIAKFFHAFAHNGRASSLVYQQMVHRT